MLLVGLIVVIVKEVYDVSCAVAILILASHLKVSTIIAIYLSSLERFGRFKRRDSLSISLLLGGDRA